MVDADGTTTYLGKEKVKSVFENAGGSFWHIIDADKQLITMVDPGQKIYGSGTPDDFCNTIKSFSDDMKEQAMAGLSPDQRKIMEEQMKQYEEMMKSSPPPKKPVAFKSSIKRTKVGEVIANHKTDRYTVTVYGEEYQDVWIATEISMLKEEKKLNLHKVYSMQKKMDSCMDGSHADMSMMADPLESAEYKKITENRLVMREITYAGGFAQDGGDTSTDIIKLERKNIPKSEFSIPSGFKKVAIKNLLSGMMGSVDMSEAGHH